MIDFEQISRMPPGLRFRLVEAVAWRSADQSDIARLQRLAIEYHENHTRQGERTDLRPDETCTQDYVQVKPSKRRANSTERAAQYWGESEATVRKRVYVLKAAEANPEKWDKYRAKKSIPRRIQYLSLSARSFGLATSGSWASIGCYAAMQRSRPTCNGCWAARALT